MFLARMRRHKQSLLIFDQNWLMFFSRPIVDVLFAVTAAGLMLPLIVRVIARLRRLPRGPAPAGR